MISYSEVERESLSHAFWESVRRKLTGDFRQPVMDADQGIALYRHEMQRREIGDLVYNQGVDKTAEVVNSIIGSGVKEPGGA